MYICIYVSRQDSPVKNLFAASYYTMKPTQNAAKMKIRTGYISRSFHIFHETLRVDELSIVLPMNIIPVATDKAASNFYLCHLLRGPKVPQTQFTPHEEGGGDDGDDDEDLEQDAAADEDADDGTGSDEDGGEDGEEEDEEDEAEDKEDEEDEEDEEDGAWGLLAS